VQRILICNRLSHLVHAESTGEFIYLWTLRFLSPDFGFSQSLSDRSVQMKKELHFLAAL